MAGKITPKKLAAELGISPKKLRDFLRLTFPRDFIDKNTAWVLTPDMVEAARKHFNQTVEIHVKVGTETEDGDMRYIDGTFTMTVPQGVAESLPTRLVPTR
jgi:malate synthase